MSSSWFLMVCSFSSSTIQLFLLSCSVCEMRFELNWRHTLKIHLVMVVTMVSQKLFIIVYFRYFHSLSLSLALILGLLVLLIFVRINYAFKRKVWRKMAFWQIVSNDISNLLDVQYFSPQKFGHALRDEANNGDIKELSASPLSPHTHTYRCLCS